MNKRRARFVFGQQLSAEYGVYSPQVMPSLYDPGSISPTGVGLQLEKHSIAAAEPQPVYGSFAHPYFSRRFQQRVAGRGAWVVGSTATSTSAATAVQSGNAVTDSKTRALWSTQAGCRLCTT
jgi:hypothetical protein